MNTMVTIRCDSDDAHSMSVPCNAILQKDGKAGVFVYTPSDNKVSRREVTIVRLMSDGRCIITSDELKPGELVVVRRNTPHTERRNRKTSARCQ